MSMLPKVASAGSGLATLIGRSGWSCLAPVRSTRVLDGKAA